MQLEDQCCSLELAKKLKELNVKQNSQFYFANAKYIGDHVLEEEVWMIAHLSQTTGISNEWYSAFTASELGDMLPSWHDSCKSADNDWHIRVFEKDKNNICNNSFDKTEADARAKMLIYLIENGLVNV